MSPVRFRAFALSLFATALTAAPVLAQPGAPSLEWTGVAPRGVEVHSRVSGLSPGEAFSIRAGDRTLVEGEADAAGNASVRLELPDSSPEETELRIEAASASAEASVRATPAWLSLLPPILAILLALIFREVLVALFCGVWAGALVVHDYSPLKASLRSLDHYAVKAVADSDHASILLFSVMLGGMIGVITKSGGGLGLAGRVTRYAKDGLRGQLATWVLGVLIFFDDYANSLLVGSSMRPITDRLRVSREKLAFIVDATAAPVSSIAIVSSWIGFELAAIGEQLDGLGIDRDPFTTFVDTIPYRFYPLLMLCFGLFIILFRRDFGPMRKAEERARKTGLLLREGAAPASDFEDIEHPDPRAINALLPILGVVAIAILGMVLYGRAACIEAGEEVTLRSAFANADSYKALLWASAGGGVIAVLSATLTGAMKANEALDAWVEGLKAMLLACVILVLAWSLGALCKELHTAQVVIAAIGDGLSPNMLSVTIFIVSALVSFATGTSWGTMAILFPLVVPLAHELAPGNEVILLGAISSILAGSVWGDHCSPISDTTIMSSMAASCDHVDHVKTQLPYALTVGVVSILFGELGTAFGWYSPWVGLLLGAVALALIVRFVGKPIEEYRPTHPSPGASESE